MTRDIGQDVLPLSATQPAGKFSLTVYSTADPATFSPQDLMQQQIYGSSSFGGGYLSNMFYTPGFGVVREVRPMQLAAGMNHLEFTDVAEGIDPTTVAFTSLTAPDSTAVLEQNFDYDMASSDKLLRKYIGQPVTLTLAGLSQYNTREPNASAAPTVTGTLLAISSGYMIRTNEARTPIVIVPASNVSSIRLADQQSGLLLKPTLNWMVNAKDAGQHQVQVTYQTDGLTWRADYSLLIAPDEKTADMSAWVTLVNGSGLSYPDATLKLIAGNVHRFVSPMRSQQQGRQQIQQSSTLFGQGYGGTPAFTEKRFFEYHLYTLDRPTSLNNNATKQIELFPPKLKIPVEKIYLYNSLTPEQREVIERNPDNVSGDFGRVGNKNVDIYVRLKNSEANHLGIPLPAGRLRSYKLDAADQSQEFVGEDVIQHTPKDERILARLGSTFDIVADHKQTDFHQTENANEETETFEITLRNHLDTEASVIIRETLYRYTNWEITKTSDPWTKRDYRTIHFPVTVPANSEKKVTYTVRYTW